MRVNTLRRFLALPMVPLIAVLSAFLLGFLQDLIVAFMDDLALHDNWYFVPNFWTYVASVLVLGFLPAILLQRITRPLFAALITPLAVTAYELIDLELNGYSSSLSLISVLLYFLLPWSIANIAGLAVWGRSA